MSEFSLSDCLRCNGGTNREHIRDIKEFIKRRLERIDLIIKLYPHKSGKELAGELKEDLLNELGDLK